MDLVVCRYLLAAMSLAAKVVMNAGHEGKRPRLGKTRAVGVYQWHHDSGSLQRDRLLIVSVFQLHSSEMKQNVNR